jgi:hypothetical protein
VKASWRTTIPSRTVHSEHLADLVQPAADAVAAAVLGDGREPERVPLHLRVEQLLLELPVRLNSS